MQVAGRRSGHIRQKELEHERQQRRRREDEELENLTDIVLEVDKAKKNYRGER